MQPERSPSSRLLHDEQESAYRAGPFATADTCTFTSTHNSLVDAARIVCGAGIGVNSDWAQGLKPPPHFYDHGARLYDEPPTFVT